MTGWLYGAVWRLILRLARLTRSGDPGQSGHATVPCRTHCTP